MRGITTQATLKSGCRSPPPACIRLASCKQITSAAKAHYAAILCFIPESSAEQGKQNLLLWGWKHLNPKVRPLSLLSHKPGPLTLWTTMLKYAEIKIYSPPTTKHACFALSQDHGPCSICCDIRAASDKTFLVPTHFGKYAKSPAPLLCKPQCSEDNVTYSREIWKNLGLMMVVLLDAAISLGNNTTLLLNS